MEKATFEAGCFWHVEEVFSKVKGVLGTKVGYTGGKEKNPSYERVCSDETGHAEAIEVTYDPSIVSYEELLDVFWKIHDPTQINRQGPDIGTQYRSAIFYYSEEQKNKAIKSKEKQQKKLKQKIATEIASIKDFYKAEEYHQRYMEKMKNPINKIINKLRY